MILNAKVDELLFANLIDPIYWLLIYEMQLEVVVQTWSIHFIIVNLWDVIIGDGGKDYALSRNTLNR